MKIAGRNFDFFFHTIRSDSNAHEETILRYIEYYTYIVERITSYNYNIDIRKW